MGLVVHNQRIEIPLYLFGYLCITRESTFHCVCVVSGAEPDNGNYIVSVGLVAYPENRNSIVSVWLVVHNQIIVIALYLWG